MIPNISPRQRYLFQRDLFRHRDGIHPRVLLALRLDAPDLGTPPLRIHGGVLANRQGRDVSAYVPWVSGPGSALGRHHGWEHENEARNLAVVRIRHRPVRVRQ